MATNTAATLRAFVESALKDTGNATWTDANIDDAVLRAVRRLWPRVGYQLDPQDHTQTLTSETYFYTLDPAIMAVSSVDLIDSDSNEVGQIPAGQWRTTGQNGYKQATLGTSAAADDILDTSVRHDFVAGDRLRFTSLTGGTGLTVGTGYHVIAGNLGATTLQISETAGGTAAGWTADITAGEIEGGDLKIHIEPTIVDAYASGTVRYHGYGRFDTVFRFIPDDHVDLVIADAVLELSRWQLAERARFKDQATKPQQTTTSVNELLNLIATYERTYDRFYRRAFTPRRPMPARV